MYRSMEARRPTSGVALDYAIDDLATIEDRDDRQNATVALHELRAYHNQPRGYTAIPMQFRPAVADYLRNHQVWMHDCVRAPHDNTIVCSVVV